MKFLITFQMNRQLICVFNEKEAELFSEKKGNTT